MKKAVVGILAHVDAGKTTLSEAMLYEAGIIRKMGRVDHQDAFLDTDAMEQKRGITIFSKQARFSYHDMEIVLLDTPGHVDFGAEMERTLQVLDYAILVISGSEGVQAHTQTLWDLLRQYGIPTFVFVNKMDLVEEALQSERKAQLLDELTHKFGDGVIDFATMQNPALDGQGEVYERMASQDETAMEEFYETDTLSVETVRGLIAERKVYPVMFGTALKDIGVTEFLDIVTTYTSQLAFANEFGARVYKISRDDQGNRLTYLKVTGDTLTVKGFLGDEKVDQIRLYNGNRFELTKHAKAGEICAVTGPTQTYAGQGIGIEDSVTEGILSPVMTYEVIPPQGVDSVKVYEKIKLLEEEDPKLFVEWEEQHKEIHIHIMGRVQLEMIKQSMLDRFQMDIDFGTGSIVYMETITRPVIGKGHFEPLRHYAEVQLLMEPLPNGSGLVFDTDVSEDELDLNWQRLIMTHLAERQHKGVLTGAYITDMRLTVIAGRAHQKHTEGGDFRQATYRAIRQGLKSTECQLLEPYYGFELTVPNEQIGRTMNDMQMMHGEFLPPETLGDMTMIKGRVPVSTSLDYMTEVHAYTKGRGKLVLKNGGYGPCHNADEVIAKRGYDSELDKWNPTGSVFCSHGSGDYVPWDEVAEHMHTEAPLTILEDGTVTTIKRAKSMEDEAHWEQRAKAIHEQNRRIAAGYEELEEIMLREFGPMKRRQLNTSSTRYVSSRQEVSEKEYAKIRERNKKKQVKQEEYLLVDGYNIIFAWDELKRLAAANIDGARGRLMDILCDYQGFVKCRLILVFDAYKVKGNHGSVEKYHNIDVVYTKEAETADAYIEKVTKEIASTHRVRVATSDGLEQMIIMGHGAIRVSAREFALEIESVKEQIREIIE